MSTSLTKVVKRFKKAFVYTTPKLVDDLLQLVDDINAPIGQLQAYLNANDANFIALGNRTTVVENEVNAILARRKVLLKSANYAILPANDGYIITADATGGTFTLTLPDAIVNPSMQIGIRKSDLSLINSVIIAAAGIDMIEGVASLPLLVANETLWLISDGAGVWRITSWDQTSLAFTWTPDLQFGGVTSGSTGTFTGKGIRRRGEVFAGFNITLTSAPVPVAGSCTVAGLPITSALLTSVGAAIAFSNNLVGLTGVLVIDINATSFRIDQWSATGSVAISPANFGATSTLRASGTYLTNP